MKSMKNIKPAYAVQLGKGVFVGATIKWQCSKCGKQANVPEKEKPYPHTMGICPCNKSGNHVW
ncbi:MAG: hypothetical protein J5817_05030, partial [Treponema sp.]|nr:hypothetical protein [Treponema sp.]